MLKLHAGVSKKVGLPGFSSASASCTIEAELDGALLNDTQGFQIVVRRAYQSCEQAVQDEIARLQGSGTSESEPGIRQTQAQPVAHEIIDVKTRLGIRGRPIGGSNSQACSASVPARAPWTSSCPGHKSPAGNAVGGDAESQWLRNPCARS